MHVLVRVSKKYITAQVGNGPVWIARNWVEVFKHIEPTDNVTVQAYTD